ncbi:hypothetical protein BKA69DRAFT_1035434 [Paraphysoderma sedebokerense]|nr:hypothetical protein BKA69DRAFT_1035434 [Paraphysoderma sedebokerense]
MSSKQFISFFYKNCLYGPISVDDFNGDVICQSLDIANGFIITDFRGNELYRFSFLKNLKPEAHSALKSDCYRKPPVVGVYILKELSIVSESVIAEFDVSTEVTFQLENAADKIESLKRKLEEPQPASRSESSIFHALRVDYPLQSHVSVSTHSHGYRLIRLAIDHLSRTYSLTVPPSSVPSSSAPTILTVHTIYSYLWYQLTLFHSPTPLYLPSDIYSTKSVEGRIDNMHVNRRLYEVARSQVSYLANNTPVYLIRDGRAIKLTKQKLENKRGRDNTCTASFLNAATAERYRKVKIFLYKVMKATGAFRDEELKELLQVVMILDEVMFYIGMKQSEAMIEYAREHIRECVGRELGLKDSTIELFSTQETDKSSLTDFRLPAQALAT